MHVSDPLPADQQKRLAKVLRLAKQIEITLAAMDKADNRADWILYWNQSHQRARIGGAMRQVRACVGTMRPRVGSPANAAHDHSPYRRRADVLPAFFSGRAIEH